MEVLWIARDGTKQLSPDEIDDVRRRDDGVLWITFDHSEEAGMAVLLDLIKARREDLEECHIRSPVPKIRPYPDHHFSAINGLARGTDGRLHFQPLKTFLNERVLVSVIGPTNVALPKEASRRDLTAVRQRLDAGDLCPQSGFELVSAIRYEMLRAHELLVASAASRIGQLELSVMQRDPVRAEALLEDLFGLRHDLQMMRTNTAQTHELYVHQIELLTSQPGLMQVDLRRFNDMRHSFGHLTNTMDLEREYLQEVLDLFQTRVSTELNRFVRKITAFGTIGIAWTVIVGIYGMNFTHMPELNWQFGYPAAIGLMALVGLVLAALFRRKGWL
jgi:magnesium transporter